ncbi:MAG: hypothetical protein K8E66_12900, partial [Phycisphaerales bacterium]|nr:hypothetical protein [Phycisphaerales bacterium]
MMAKRATILIIPCLLVLWALGGCVGFHRSYDFHMLVTRINSEEPVPDLEFRVVCFHMLGGSANPTDVNVVTDQDGRVRFKLYSTPFIDIFS